MTALRLSDYNAAADFLDGTARTGEERDSGTLGEDGWWSSSSEGQEEGDDRKNAARSSSTVYLPGGEDEGAGRTNNNTGGGGVDKGGGAEVEASGGGNQRKRRRAPANPQHFMLENQKSQQERMHREKVETHKSVMSEFADKLQRGRAQNAASASNPSQLEARRLAMDERRQKIDLLEKAWQHAKEAHSSGYADKESVRKAYLAMQKALNRATARWSSIHTGTLEFCAWVTLRVLCLGDPCLLTRSIWCFSMCRACR